MGDDACGDVVPCETCEEAVPVPPCVDGSGDAEFDFVGSAPDLDPLEGSLADGEAMHFRGVRISQGSVLPCGFETTVAGVVGWEPCEGGGEWGDVFLERGDGFLFERDGGDIEELAGEGEFGGEFFLETGGVGFDGFDFFDGAADVVALVPCAGSAAGDLSAFGDERAGGFAAEEGSEDGLADVDGGADACGVGLGAFAVVGGGGAGAGVFSGADFRAPFAFDVGEFEVAFFACGVLEAGAEVAFGFAGTGDFAEGWAGEEIERAVVIDVVDGGVACGGGVTA